jgi:hypothetical protein
MDGRHYVVATTIKQPLHCKVILAESLYQLHV